MLSIPDREDNFAISGQMMTNKTFIHHEFAAYAPTGMAFVEARNCFNSSAGNGLLKKYP